MIYIILVCVPTKILNYFIPIGGLIINPKKTSVEWLR